MSTLKGRQSVFHIPPVSVRVSVTSATFAASTVLVADSLSDSASAGVTLMSSRAKNLLFEVSVNFICVVSVAPYILWVTWLNVAALLFLL